MTGERGKGKRLPFCKHPNQPGHLCNQPVGGYQHPEEGENRNPLPHRLRLPPQRCLQPSQILPPVSLEHPRLLHPLPVEHPPPPPAHLLEQTGASGHCCLSLHHGVPCSFCTEPRRGENGGLVIGHKWLIGCNLNKHRCGKSCFLRYPPWAWASAPSSCSRLSSVTATFSVLAGRNSSGGSQISFEIMFCSSLDTTKLTSMQVLVQVAMSSRALSGTPSDFFPTWSLGTCSYLRQSSIVPYSNSGNHKI